MIFFQHAGVIVMGFFMTPVLFPGPVSGLVERLAPRSWHVRICGLVTLVVVSALAGIGAICYFLLDPHPAWWPPLMVFGGFAAGRLAAYPLSHHFFGEGPD